VKFLDLELEVFLPLTRVTYPLIIIDGMPVYSGDLGGYANTNALADLNPSDIESF
jgi:hypothetical protein